MSDLRTSRLGDAFIRVGDRCSSLALLATGCGTTRALPVTDRRHPTAAPTPPPSPPPPAASTSPAASADVGAIYDAIEQQVVEIRGLQPKREVARQFIDEAELRDDA